MALKSQSAYITCFALKSYLKKFKDPLTYIYKSYMINCFLYCFFKMNAEVNFLWAHHQAHHNSETMSFATTFRLPLMRDGLFTVGLAFIIFYFKKKTTFNFVC